MGSYRVSSKQKSDGSYYWRVIETVRRDGGQKDRQIPKSELPRLGFAQSMSVDQARQRVTDLNAFNRNSTVEEKRSREAQISAAGRVGRVKRIQSVLIPDDLAVSFENEVMGRRVGSPANNRRLISHWNTVQRIITDLKLEPHQYADRDSEDAFYSWCIEHEAALDTVVKYRSMLNMWGRYFSKQRKVFFEEMPAPNDLFRERIRETYEESKSYRGASEPLTEAMLKHLKSKLSERPEHWNFIFICFWLGLRPSECDWLHAGEFQIYNDDETGCDVIRIYQKKLIKVWKKERWKLIPCFLDNQMLALEMIKSGAFRRPLTKTIKSYLDNEKVTLYGPRRNFYTMMINDYGRSNEEVSAWMGHRSVGDPNSNSGRKNNIGFNTYRDMSRVVWQSRKIDPADSKAS